MTVGSSLRERGMVVKACLISSGPWGILPLSGGNPYRQYCAGLGQLRTQLQQRVGRACDRHVHAARVGELDHCASDGIELGAVAALEVASHRRFAVVGPTFDDGPSPRAGLR